MSPAPPRLREGDVSTADGGVADLKSSTCSATTSSSGETSVARGVSEASPALLQDPESGILPLPRPFGAELVESEGGVTVANSSFVVADSDPSRPAERINNAFEEMLTVGIGFGFTCEALSSSCVRRVIRSEGSLTRH